MNKMLSLLLATTLLASCSKDPIDNGPAPVAMRYTDLHNAEVANGTFQRLDVDGDGTADYYFKTELVGDALGQRDRLQFYALSRIDTYLPVNESEGVPRLSRGDTVRVQFPAYTWYEISAIVLAEKITPLTGAPWWDGDWKAATHHYLPLQVRRGDRAFYGWVELSFDTAAEKLVLHRAAIAEEAGREVRAGD